MYAGFVPVHVFYRDAVKAPLGFELRSGLNRSAQIKKKRHTLGVCRYRSQSFSSMRIVGYLLIDFLPEVAHLKTKWSRWCDEWRRHIM